MEQWDNYLRTLKIDDKYLEKIKMYVNQHILYETLYPNSNRLINTTVPFALYILSNLNLDNVEIISTPTYTINEKQYGVENFDLSVQINENDIEKINSIELEQQLNKRILDNSIEYITNMMSDKKIYIYSLCNSIKKSKNEIVISHRFFIK